jgi:hypothetical protein
MIEVLEGESVHKIARAQQNNTAHVSLEPTELT